MSFDQEPTDRRLLYHTEADQLFETCNPAEIAEYMENVWVMDVTDSPKYEERFKQEQAEKVKEKSLRSVLNTVHHKLRENQE